jgi:hypothetical protein
MEARLHKTLKMNEKKKNVVVFGFKIATRAEKLNPT